MLLDTFLKIYNKKFWWIKKYLYLCNVNNSCDWNNIKISNRRVSGVIRHRLKIPARAKIKTPAFVGVCFYCIFINNMSNLRGLIKKTLLEYTDKYPIKKGGLQYDGNQYNIVSTYHQWFDRHGDNDYETNLDLFFEKNADNNKYRVGVSDQILVPLIKNNGPKIIESFNTINPCSKRIIFTKKRLDNEDEEFFDVIEFILQKDNRSLKIVTSAFSEDGLYLLLGIKTKTDKINLKENFCSDELEIVEL